MTSSNLHTKLTDLENSLKELSAQRETLLQQIREEEFLEIQERVLRWNLQLNDHLVLLAKSCSAFYKTRCVKITSVNDSYYSTIVGEYNDAFGSKEFRCHDDKPISHACLKQLEQDYFVYVVTEQDYQMFILNMCNLSLDDNALQEHINYFSRSALRVIS